MIENKDAVLSAFRKIESEVFNTESFEAEIAEREHEINMISEHTEIVMRIL